MESMPPATNLFRKAALDHLSSPEQLDRLLEVSSPGLWVAFLGMTCVVTVALVWGFAGRVNSDVIGRGVLVRPGGVQVVASKGSGEIATLTVSVGQIISVGSVVATLRQPALEDQIVATRGDIAALEAQLASVKKLHSGGSGLESSTLNARQQSTESDLRNLEAQSADLRLRINTDTGLLAKGLITKQELSEAQRKLASLEASEQEHRSVLRQIETDRFRTRTEAIPESVGISGRIDAARIRLQTALHEMELQGTVRTPYSGRVIELKSQTGALVSAGQPLISLQASDGAVYALVYVSAAEAKQIETGMAAQVSPTQFRREEYGFIQGSVKEVSSYPSTPAALMEKLANSALVASLTAAGPVFEAQIALTPDVNSPSGVRWSSRHSVDGPLTPGTIVTTDVIVKEQSPVSLIIPYVRKKMGLR